MNKEDFLSHFESSPEVDVLTAIIDHIEADGISFEGIYDEVGGEVDLDIDEYYGFDDDDKRRAFAVANAFNIQLLINQIFYEERGCYMIEEDDDHYAWYLCGYALRHLIICIETVKEDKEARQ